jgi:uncharacterized membrane protein YoaK (UPF0700 family)
VVTGLVDAFSYLILGHVFVANMTGNVVFFGFTVAGVGTLGGISWSATLLAVAAFGAGAAGGGRWAARRSPHRGHLLAQTVVAQSVLVTAAAIVASGTEVHKTAPRMILIALLASAMGAQNATVRRLAVPDLTTTVLTLTVTGLFADSSPAAVRIRRLEGLAAMAAGAALGGGLLRGIGRPAPLWAAAGVLIVCAGASFALARRPGSERWR